MQSEAYRRRMAIEEAKKQILMKKKRKEAVLLIENYRYWQLHKRELRLLRGYLKKLPYECRRVYFKFVEVKRSSNALMNSYMGFI